MGRAPGLIELMQGLKSAPRVLQRHINAARGVLAHSRIKRRKKGTKMADFKHPGEHAYEGVTYTQSVPKESLEKVKDMELRSDDVILATFPKSG